MDSLEKIQIGCFLGLFLIAIPMWVAWGQSRDEVKALEKEVAFLKKCNKDMFKANWEPVGNNSILFRRKGCQ